MSTQECLDRSSMDRRRLEMAHLKHAVLTVCQWYSPCLRMNEVKFVPGKLMILYRCLQVRITLVFLLDMQVPQLPVCIMSQICIVI